MELENARRSAPRHSPRAFTLVELLVVIGIIAVLTAMLLPGVAGARRHANAIACAANLREIARACALYAHENRDLYPWAQFNYTPANGGQQRVITWDDLISKYLDVPLTEAEINSAYAPREAKIFMCGEDLRVRDPYVVTLLPNQENFIRSYGVSCNPGMGDNNAKFEGFGGQMATGEPIPWNLIRGTLCVKQSQFRAAAETILAFDMPIRINNLGGFYAYAGRPYDQIVTYTGVAELGRKGIHGKRYNYAFCDGHVEPLEPIQTVRPNSGTWYYDYNYMWTRNPKD